MKKIILIAISIFLTGQIIVAQNPGADQAFSILQERGEVYLQINGELEIFSLDQLSKVISIDKVTNEQILAYANKKQFTSLLELNIPFKVLQAPSMLYKPKMLTAGEATRNRDWDSYPTYEAYLAIMEQFTIDYSNLCELVNIGTTNEGRELLCIHINNNLGEDQDEPEFLYTSSMHGDELTGYVVMLRFIEYLLENYGTNDQVTNLVDNIDIWINPLANPDGTYAGGNNTVFGATRGNAYNIDLNRNYPDPEDGDHPDGNAWQTETIHFMDFAEERNFVMAANFHGGAEVVNYPWDTWSTRHADTEWWELVSRQFADTAHVYSPNGYMTFMDNGVTNGYDWYSISGGRQDYMNYFHHCREVTLEVSNNKTPPANQLPNFWEYLHRSCLNYMEQVLYGFRGLVTDASNGVPLAAEIFINGHDEDESQVYAELPVGNYHRPIKEGIYNITFSHPGYFSQTFSNVNPTDANTLILDVQLVSSEPLSAEFIADNLNPNTMDNVQFTDLSTGSPNSWEWSFSPSDVTYMEGTSENSQNPLVRFNTLGYYSVQLTVSNNDGSDTENKINYINVAPPPDEPIADFIADITTGTAPLTVIFTDLSQNEITSWYWDFGNGGWSTQQNPTYTFYAPGNYTISLTCEGPGGSDTEVKAEYILVNHPLPVVDFTASPTSGEVPLSVSFTDISEGTIDSWFWEFGDGGNSTEQHPEHTYTQSDIFTVSLTVSGPGGSETLVKEDFINTSNVLNLYASATPDVICEEDFSQLNAYPSGGTGSYSFTWTSNPPGFNSNEQNPVVFPVLNTTYTVVVNDGEQSISDNVVVSVNPLPEIILGDWPEQVCNEQEPPIQLTAMPEGGTFSGVYVSPTGVFTPESAELGWNVITYSYIDANNCQASKSDSIFVDSCLSFNFETSAEINSVFIFPNPFINEVSIKLKEGTYEIKVLSTSGKIVKSADLVGNSLSLNLSSLDHGIYIIQIKSKNWVISRKIVKYR